MALTERKVIGQIGIHENGQLNVREDLVVERDGRPVFREFHRRVLDPGQDMTAETNARLRAVAQAVWTAEVVATFRAQRQAQLLAIDSVRAR